MPVSRASAAPEIARTIVQRHLLAALSQLDSETPEVEIHKQLYVDLIREAIHLASERLSDNGALVEMIEKLFGHLAPPAAKPVLLRCG